MIKQSLSIVVPTLNEEENLPALLKRIDDTLKPACITYEVIVIDDHSTDNTVAAAKRLQNYYPVMVYEKRGTRGKAYSLLEGFDKCRYRVVAMIDADLQYPPEALSEMHNVLNETGADVVVTRREDKKTSLLRKLSSYTFNLIFSKMLFGIDFDTQSGLKMFKKEVLNHFPMNPSPWSFDQEFIVRSLEHKFTIISHTIPFSERTAGVTKVKVLNVTYELAKASLNLRWRTSLARIKEGTEANNQFIKRTFPFAVLTIFISSLLTFMPAQSYAAQNRGHYDQRKTNSNQRKTNNNFAQYYNSRANKSKPTQSTQIHQTHAPLRATPTSPSAHNPSKNAITAEPPPTVTSLKIEHPTTDLTRSDAPTKNTVSVNTASYNPPTNPYTLKNFYAHDASQKTESQNLASNISAGSKFALIGGGTILSASLLSVFYPHLRMRLAQFYNR